MYCFALALLAIVPIAADLPDFQSLGYNGSVAHRVTRTQPADLGVSGRASELLIEQALVPAGPVEDWAAQSRSAREKGERLPDRLPVAELVVTYADDRTVVSNIRYGESVGAAVRDWWNPVDGFIYHLAFAQVVRVEPLQEDSLRHAVVYRMEWPNPRPEVPIESVSLRAAGGLGEGKLLVFSAEGNYRPAPGNTFFVAPDGNDEAEGSFDRPWGTLHKAAASIEAGDTVYVRGGTYRPTQRVVFKYLDASPVQRTRVIGYPGETAVFDFMDAHWDTSPERRQYGFEVYPVNAAMIMAYDCDRFTFKNLHLVHSRSRGFGMETGYYDWHANPDLIDGGRPEQVNNEPYVDSEILYCTVYRTMDTGIRFSRGRDSRLIGNVVIRPQSISMGAARKEDLGSGPVAGLEATKFFNHLGEEKRNPPMEGIDCGRFADIEIAYNEIGWGDKEAMLIDGDVDGLRVHHNYVHDAWNTGWVWGWTTGIGPNGYGEQQDIEIDHNIAHHVGKGFSAGTEGGGFGKNIRIHHNLAFDCHWTGLGLSGAWKSNASLYDISVYNNTLFHNGHYTRNPHFPWRENTHMLGGIVVSFPRPTLEGSVEDVVIANNLILQPRDYALALRHEGDPEESRIVLTNNLTDLETETDISQRTVDESWRPVRDEKLIVYTGGVVRDPRAHDFRLLPDTPAIDGGVAIDENGKPLPGRSTYIGAFGPDAQWVEIEVGQDNS